MLPGNDERHIRFYVNAVADGTGGEGAEEAAIVYAVETTEQKALEGQMAQSQKMQAVGQLAGGIAHDFNNVLTAIIMASDLLLTNHRPSDPSFPDIMNIKQNANRAASLVRQLLAFSRKQTLRPEVLNLTDVLADLRMLLARLVGNDIKLKVDHGRDLWPVKADIGQFEQVIVNLAVNARDAMPDGGDADHPHPQRDGRRMQAVRLPRAGAGRLCAGRGRGHRHRHRARRCSKKIFEPFFTTKEVGKGTGLGLSMVYGIIKQTGGFIYCDSEVGKGTIFRIFLPRHVAESAAGRSDGVAEASAGGEARGRIRPSQPDAAEDLSGSATVLLVEDEEAVRMGGMRALTSRGYTVHEASSGVEALEIFHAARRQDRHRRLRRRHAGNGRADAARRTAQDAARHQVHLRLRLCRGRLRQEPAGRGEIRLPAEAVLAEAAGDDGEGGAGELSAAILRGSLRSHLRMRTLVPANLSVRLDAWIRRKSVELGELLAPTSSS